MTTVDEVFNYYLFITTKRVHIGKSRLWLESIFSSFPHCVVNFQSLAEYFFQSSVGFWERTFWVTRTFDGIKSFVYRETDKSRSNFQGTSRHEPLKQSLKLSNSYWNTCFPLKVSDMTQLRLFQEHCQIRLRLSWSFFYDSLQLKVYFYACISFRLLLLMKYIIEKDSKDLEKTYTTNSRSLARFFLIYIEKSRKKKLSERRIYPNKNRM